ncbi:hypothetical protein EDEG_03738 [Edhazardia aedis USNM 41457]|uniref:MutL C-terminal dimerisation domain-containing protein n=1 Tax=Edhazardia aedis (strain USNM 41457) TaxID=1003232 RepID=J9D1M4_EDHAE|nr:hypothetical protein EDEG_03738 [Edhazardia aedis USNM 41457]|eukprot:EJW01741.1 hypothetical protein EDEG_03738 [Edhazardia aedis USNM 41457]
MNYIKEIADILRKNEATHMELSHTNYDFTIYGNIKKSAYIELYEYMQTSGKNIFDSEIIIIEKLIGSSKMGTIRKYKNASLKIEITYKYGLTIYGIAKHRYLNHIKYIFNYYNINYKKFFISTFLETLNAKLFESKSIGHYKNNLKCKHNIFDKHGSVKIIGQFNCEFILVSINANLFVLDQHACHERVRLEMLIRKYDKDKLGEFSLDEMKQKACRGAIKFGMKLDGQEVESLIRNLFDCNFSEICAHGRPSMLKIKDSS